MHQEVMTKIRNFLCKNWIVQKVMEQGIKAFEC